MKLNFCWNQFAISKLPRWFFVFLFIIQITAIRQNCFTIITFFTWSLWWIHSRFWRALTFWRHTVYTAAEWTELNRINLSLFIGFAGHVINRDKNILKSQNAHTLISVCNGAPNWSTRSCSSHTISLRTRKPNRFHGNQSSASLSTICIFNAQVGKSIQFQFWRTSTCIYKQFTCAQNASPF